jgi:hypothetical protein
MEPADPPAFSFMGAGFAAHSPVSELTRGRSNCILRPPFPVTQKMNSILNYEQSKLILRDLHIGIQG